MTIQSRTHRVAHLGAPRPITVEIHDMDCLCPSCEPYRPSYAPRLTAGSIGKLGLAGIAAGFVAAVMLDPAHAARSALAIVGVGL